VPADLLPAKSALSPEKEKTHHRYQMLGLKALFTGGAMTGGKIH
jgi:hypothetical protein